MNNGPLVPKIASLPSKVHLYSRKQKEFQKAVTVNHVVTGKGGGTEFKTEIERYHFLSKWSLTFMNASRRIKSKTLPQR